jgi:hypothetical protein
MLRSVAFGPTIFATSISSLWRSAVSHTKLTPRVSFIALRNGTEIWKLVCSIRRLPLRWNVIRLCMAACFLLMECRGANPGETHERVIEKWLITLRMPNYAAFRLL